jgi:putative phosphonate catabolism associated alcohol dehydrogenase
MSSREPQETSGLPADALAAVFTAAGTPLELQRFPLTDLHANEILVRITFCTVCGSDLHTYQGDRHTPTPTVLGHEILGNIVALGAGTPVDHGGETLAVGDRITWSVAASCSECFYCERGVPQKCEQLFKYGHESTAKRHALSGGLAEYCVLAPGTAVVRLPTSLQDAVACPSNCATATVAAALRTGELAPGESVLVQGAGMLGLTACAMARSQGAHQIIVCDVDAARVRLASRFGATQAITTDDSATAVTAAVSDLTAGRGVDLAVELSGARAAPDAGIPQLRIGGRYVLVGAVFPGQTLSLPSETIVRRLLHIHGVHNYTPNDLVAAVRFLEENQSKYPFEELVGRTFPLDEADAALRWAIETRALRVGVAPKAASASRA